MVLLAALSQNVATGSMFGSIGALVVPIEQRMDVDRALGSAGGSLVILAIGLIAPFLGRLIMRFGLRRLMIAGALFCAGGYAAASLATNVWLLLLCYGLLIGPGVALLGVAVPTTLVANWFVTGRGKAIGIVNMPIAVALVPPIIAVLLPRFGLDGIYRVLAMGSLLLVPALFWVIERPEHLGMQPHGQGGGASIEAGSAMSATALLRTGDYRRLALAAAMMGGGGALVATHIMSFAMGEGVAAPLAALLLSFVGAAGVLGSLAYGMLADRFGGRRALAVNALCQALLWAGLLIPMAYVPRAVLVALIGINAGGMITSLGTALSQRFGTAALGGALGLWSLLNLPFTVGMPPLAGFLFERLGGYEAAFAVQIALFLLAALLTGVVRGTHSSRERSEGMSSA